MVSWCTRNCEYDRADERSLADDIRGVRTVPRRRDEARAPQGRAPPATVRHSHVRHEIYDALEPFVRQRQIGDVHIVAGFLLSADTWLQPDVSFVRSPQVEVTDPDGYYQGSSAVAVEVASDSNMAEHLDRKIELYFAHGSEEVWIVYPKTRKVCVHYRDGTSRTVAGSELRSDVFPGWSIAVDTLFQD
ncbi:MAG TPA: Uma2 family endonuclease [Bryobacteraceae bacterium]|nr:Uma2 family endonuclease [Bryobacteraceae bacterium]